MLHHPLTNFEIQKYYQNEPKFNGVYSRNNLPKIKDGAYVINLVDFKAIRTQWIALYMNGYSRRGSIYFDNLGVEHIPKEMITNIYRIYACNSIMCWYFCIGFIDFMLKDKPLLDYTDLFSPSDYEKNDEITPKYFQ